MLVRKIQQHITNNHLLQEGDTVIVGVSGGPDSTALITLLANIQLNLNIIAIYVDHGLRPGEVQEEQRFIEELAERLQIPCHCRYADVRGYKTQHRCSLEDAARKLRYAILEEYRQHYDASRIAVAHTADDQAEELLIRLIRGSGLKGLSAMSSISGYIIRPLLAISKHELIQYLKRQNIEYCYDSSNADQSFLRNRVRLQLLPELERHYNPSIRTTLHQTANILQTDEALLEDLTNQLFLQLCEVDKRTTAASPPAHVSFVQQAFNDAHPALQRRLLEKVCWLMDSRPSFRKIIDLQKLANTGYTGQEMHLTGGVTATCRHGRFILTTVSDQKTTRGRGRQALPSAAINIFVDAPGEVSFAGLRKKLRTTISENAEDTNTEQGVLSVDADLIKFPLQVRATRPGERITPFGAPGSKKINRFLTDRKIHGHDRSRHPVLVSNEEIVAILGIQIDARFQVTEATRKVLHIYWETLDA